MKTDRTLEEIRREGLAALRQRLGGQGRRHVEASFTFAAQSVQYQRLFADMGITRKGAPRPKLKLVAAE